MPFSFWIHRPQYPHWYAGHNAFGSMWSSSAEDGAIAVPVHFLPAVLIALEPEDTKRDSSHDPKKCLSVVRATK